MPIFLLRFIWPNLWTSFQTAVVPKQSDLLLQGDELDRPARHHPILRHRDPLRRRLRGLWLRVQQRLHRRQRRAADRAVLPAAADREDTEELKKFHQKIRCHYTTAFTFKSLLRHYAKRALTPRSFNVKLDTMLTKPPVPYDNCVADPISCWETVGSTPVLHSVLIVT